MDSWNNGRSGNAVLVDSPWTPNGVHGNVWGSVKSSHVPLLTSTINGLKIDAVRVQMISR
jgi:hypothetical protein